MGLGAAARVSGNLQQALNAKDAKDAKDAKETDTGRQDAKKTIA